MSDQEYLLVRAAALPDVFRKVIEVKRLVDMKEVRSVNQAVRQVGISRSAYYKYVRDVRVFEETKRGDLFRLFVVAENLSGVLPRLLETVPATGCRLVSLNQDVAIKGLSLITLTVDSEDSDAVTREQELIDALSQVQGVVRVEAIG
jgi:chorismate mutase